MSEEIDDAIKRAMTRLLKTTVDNLDIAFARHDTSEREAALAHARRLLESQDPAERELGERLKAEVLKEPSQGHISSTTVDARVVEEPSKLAHQQQLASNLTAPSPNGAPTNPLSQRSSLPSPAAASKSPAANQEPPQKRGPGRPRKNPDATLPPKGKQTPEG